MKRLLPLLAGVVLGLGLAQGVPPDWPDPFEMEFEPLAPAALEPQRYTFDNGLIVYLLEDHSLPLVDGVAYVRAPSVFDPQDRVGLAAMTADLMRTGGAAGRSPEELDETLELLAASVEGSANNLFAAVGFSALAENTDEVLGLWADVLLRPDFDTGRLEVLRGRLLEDLRRQNDQPVQVAQREFLARVAEGHPSGQFPTPETVDAVAREDVADFYQRYYVPNATIMAVSGDFDSTEMLEQLRDVFGDWQRREVDLPELPPYDPDPEPRVYYAPKEIGQSVIFLGHPTVTAYSEPYAELTVANGILGGESFSSRITTEIRTRRGLAYATGSGVTQGFRFPGVFFAYSLSRAEATAEVISLLLEQIRRIREEGVSEAELERQKETILSREVFRFADATEVAQRTARAEFFGLPADYYQDYVEQVQATTPEDVQQVARTQFHAEEMVIMVVGDDALFDRPLSEFGEVVVIELE